MSKPVISGYGVISAIGLNKEETLRSLLERKSGIGPLQHLETIHKHLPCGEVKLSNEQMMEHLQVTSDIPTNRSALMGALALREALQQAGIEDTSKAILINGTTVGGMDQTEEFFQNDAELLSHLPQHTCGGTTQSILQLTGLEVRRHTTLSTACSSAANALLLASELIRTGQAEVVIAGGTEALTRFHLNGFNTLMILDQEPCRPFDATRAGLNLGEGAAFFIVESEQHLQERGAQALAELAGAGNACDAFHQTASSDNGEGAFLAMQKACLQAAIRPNEVDYVNAHGTGTPNNDVSESVALQRIFGEQIPPVSSTKAFTGHTTSVSGAIETAICLLALEHQFLPAQLHWANPMPDGIRPTQGADHHNMNCVMCNSFGFGGNDTSLILRLPSNNADIIQETFNPNIACIKCEAPSPSEIDLSKFGISKMETRRMGALMKAALFTSLSALQEAGIETPDAIIVATDWGMWEYSEQFLQQMIEQEEQFLKPTLFMQSTHNTLAGALAIRTHCHGYNTTFSNGKNSLQDALDDAKRLIKSGLAKNVLVGLHDEITPRLSELLHQLTGQEHPIGVHSEAYVLTIQK